MPPVERKLKAPIWLLLVIAALTILNGYDVFGTLTISAQYAALDVPFSPAVKLIFALFWTAVLAILTLGLLRRSRRAFAWTGPLLTVYSAAGLLWAAAFVRADYGRGRLGFQAIVAIVTLIPIWWVVVRNRWMKPL